MLPILPLKAVCLPGEVLTVQITEERYQKLIQRCMNHAGEVAVVFCSDYKDELGTMRNVGCQAKIVHFEVCISGDFEIQLIGLYRFKFTSTQPKLDIFYASHIEKLEDVIDIAGTDNLFLEVNETYQNYLKELQKFDHEFMPENTLDNIGYTDTFKLMNDISISWENKQQGIELNSIKKRLEHILSCLHFERDMLNFLSEKGADEEVAIKALTSLN
jgi:Lon protease-like protein